MASTGLDLGWRRLALRSNVDKRRVLRVIGETLREIGILMIVFAPLDAAFHPEGAEPWSLSFVVLGALVSIGVGIMLETEED